MTFAAFQARHNRGELLRDGDNAQYPSSSEESGIAPLPQVGALLQSIIDSNACNPGDVAPVPRTKKLDAFSFCWTDYPRLRELKNVFIDLRPPDQGDEVELRTKFLLVTGKTATGKPEATCAIFDSPHCSSSCADLTNFNPAIHDGIYMLQRRARR